MAIKPTQATFGITRTAQPSSNTSSSNSSTVSSQLLVQSVGRTPADSTLARVQGAAAVTPEQRQILVNRLQEAIARWETQPHSPAREQALNRLGEQQQLLKAPALKLVRLQINQSALVTYTDRPMAKGDPVRVYLDNNRLWQLGRLQTEHPPSGAYTERARSGAPGRPAEQALLAQVLRNILPLADKPALGPILTQLEPLPAGLQRQWFSTRLQQALKQAAQQLRQPAQLTQPNGVRSALMNSGTLLESKLAQTISLGQEGSESTVRRNADSVHRALSGDWKGALLKVLTHIKGDLGRLGQAAELKPGSLENGLRQLITQLNPQSSAQPNAELSERVQRIQLLQLLHQLTLHSLARVQLQQLQGLSHQQAQADGPQATQSWGMEIPMRLGQEVYPLLLRIDQQWLDTPEEAKRRAGKVRQWQVVLSIELPESGPLHAQVTVREQKVATRLWSESEETVEKIQKRLPQLQSSLEKDGIEVTRLECLKGAPPRQKTEIHYSLVDITT